MVFVIRGSGSVIKVRWHDSDKLQRRRSFTGVYGTREEAEKALFLIKRLCQNLAKFSRWSGDSGEVKLKDNTSSISLSTT